MPGTGLGETIFNPSSFNFPERNEALFPSLKSSDFETAIQIPDKTAPHAGIFVLPVATLRGTEPGGAGRTLPLYAAVAVNRQTMAGLLAAGNAPCPTLMQASAEARRLNRLTEDRVRSLPAARWVRENIDLRAFVAPVPAVTAQPA